MRSHIRRDTRTIAIDARMLGQPQCFGISRVIMEMVRHFPANPDVPVTLLAPERTPERFDLAVLPDAVDIVSCRTPITEPYRFADLARIVRDRHAGVLYSPYHALAPLWVPCPQVVSVHDCIFEADLRLTGGRFRQLAYATNTSRVLRQAVAVCVPSQATAATLPGYYRHVPPITVCRNGVNTEDFAPHSPAELDRIRRRLGLPSRYVLNVGSRRSHKNQSLLVRALAGMDPSICLVMVGRRDSRSFDEVDHLVVDLGLKDRVMILDGVSDHDLIAIYQLAGVFAFPSLAEGFGLPPLEAMAAGVPVVASSIPVVAEVCGDAAVLVSPHDARAWTHALTSVVESPELRSAMIDRGFKSAAAAGWRDGADALFTLLTRVAQGLQR